MRERINADIKQALKQGEKEKVAVLRLMNAAIQSADIDLGTKGKPRLEGADLVAVLQRMVKQRRDSIEQFNKGGRPDLSAKEQAEIAIIETYLQRYPSGTFAGLARAMIQDMRRVAALPVASHPYLVQALAPRCPMIKGGAFTLFTLFIRSCVNENKAAISSQEEKSSLTTRSAQ